ncbi:hypothetical protein A4H02_07215 [Fervidobacterium thailandense]|uniref:Uncharacterized protein n=1 Tax=Fervidobacterium thailandense TaxID=1008305 RepID=A0A1E3G1G7_9BACT|nr:hypothetical protein A4H02_07215 [Fervidobacterium thailandense]
MLISILLLTMFIVPIAKGFNVSLDGYIFEAALYAGLWKTELHKNYISESLCELRTPSLKIIRRQSEPCLKGLYIVPFHYVKAGTFYSGRTVEPILFKIGGK